MVNQLKEQDDLDDAEREIQRLRRILEEVRTKAQRNVDCCLRGHSQVAEEFCYELAELEF